MGLRSQITHLQDGILVQGSVDDPAAVASALNTALGDDKLRERCADNGEARVLRSGLVYEQLARWVDVLGDIAARRERAAQLAFGGDEAGNTAAAYAPQPPQRAGEGASGWVPNAW